MNTLHAHIESESADCDGRISRDWVEFFNDEEVAEHEKEFNDFSDINFMQRVLAMVASPYAVQSMNVAIDQNGIEVHEDTEEGYRAFGVKWCTDACGSTSHYRDHRAESMGY